MTLTETETKYIEHDFNLPNHCNELQKASDIIKELTNRFDKFQFHAFITDVEHDTTYNETIKILDYVGRLSNYVFNIEEDIERMYRKQYPKSPELSKKLCFDHYEELHKPYTRLKNRCFRLLEDLDDFYINVRGKNPPNWNI